VKLSRPYLGLFAKKNAFFLGYFLNIASFHGKHKIKTLTKKVSKFFAKKPKYNMSQNVRWFKRFMTKKTKKEIGTKTHRGKKVLLYGFSDIFRITRYKKLNNCFSTFCKKAENYKLICLHCQDERGRSRNAGKGAV